MPKIPRDPRALHDQVIDHGLVGVPNDRLLALILIELRRLREDLATYYDRKEAT